MNKIEKLLNPLRFISEKEKEYLIDVINSMEEHDYVYDILQKISFSIQELSELCDMILDLYSEPLVKFQNLSPKMIDRILEINSKNEIEDLYPGCYMNDQKWPEQYYIKYGWGKDIRETHTFVLDGAQTRGVGVNSVGMLYFYKCSKCGLKTCGVSFEHNFPFPNQEDNKYTCDNYIIRNIIK